MNQTIAQRATTTIGEDGGVDTSTRDQLVDDLCVGVPYLLRIYRGRDRMLREAEAAAKAKGWDMSGSLADFIREKLL